MNMPSDVQKWLEDFRIEVETKGPTAILNSLVQMGVENPSHCTCDDDFQDPALVWCHAHHVELNREVYKILAEKPGLITKIRRAVRNDLHTTSGMEDDPNGEFGKIVQKDFARDLLAHFLTRDPAWVKELEKAPAA
ncbi:MAG: hypothetical protein Q7S16_03145 [bacterium]|nr:hypothetical protein [bacterium]